MPTGAQLTAKIADVLRVKRNAYGPQFVDASVRYAVEAKISETTNRVDVAYPRYFQAADHIIRNMPLASSIDNYLRTHDQNSEITFCGKIAIVASILDAERKSTLYTSERLDFDKISNTWFNRLAKLLFNDVPRDSVGDLFRGISFINFNYDRCIEEFFTHAVESWFGIDKSDSERLVAELKIVRPYGRVGPLPLNGADNSIAFGDIERGCTPAIAQQIRTFNERIDERATIDQMLDLLRDSSIIVFLGFAYHPINMQLLDIGRSQQPYLKHIFGTRLQISEFNTMGIINNLNDLFQNNQRNANLVINLFDLSCVDLFDQIGRSLPRL